MSVDTISYPSLDILVQSCLPTKIRAYTTFFASKKALSKFISKNISSHPLIVNELSSLVVDMGRCGILTLDGDTSYKALVVMGADHTSGSDVYVFCKVTYALSGDAAARIYLHTNRKYMTPIVNNIISADGNLAPELLTHTSILMISNFLYNVARTRGRSLAPFTHDMGSRSFDSFGRSDLKKIVRRINKERGTTLWGGVDQDFIYETLGYRQEATKKIQVLGTWMDMVNDSGSARVLVIIHNKPKICIRTVAFLPHWSDIPKFQQQGRNMPLVISATLEDSIVVGSILGFVDNLANVTAIGQH